MSVLAALALCRFAGDAAAMLIWGAVLYVWTLVPRGLASQVMSRLRPWAVAASGVLAVATSAKLPVAAASIGDGWRDAIDPGLIAAVLTATSVGWSWCVQAVGVVALVAAAGLPARRYLAVAAPASGLVLAGLGLTGHAVMNEGLAGGLHRATDMVHVLAAGAWFGALVPVVAILRRRETGAAAVEAACALRRFSRAGHVAVVLVLVSGLANAAFVLGRWPTGASSTYDLLFDAKIACVAGLVGLAIVNRYVFVPRLARDRTALDALRRGTLAELPLGFAAIALVAVFGLLDPR